MNEPDFSALCAKFGIAQGPTGLILPKRRLDGKVVTASGALRCTLLGKTIANNSGRTSLIQALTRNGTVVAVKRPRDPLIDMTREAMLQSLAHQALVQEGVVGAVAEVYDIFHDFGEIQFSMEWVEGRPIDQALEAAAAGGQKVLDELLRDTILQLAAIRYGIQRHLRLDHRDMHVKNIWVRERPISYTIRVAGQQRTITSPRQIVLLDFGFACLGDANRRSTVNLGNVFPDTDWCPKPGRDMYVVVNRLLDVAGVWEGISPGLRGELLGRMGAAGRGDPYRILLDTSDPKFELAAMTPEAILG